MQILFISHKYPPTIGGMEKQSYELVCGVEPYHQVHKVLYDAHQENRVQFFFRLKKRVKKILRDHPDIDIIHLNDGLMGYFGLWLQKYTKIPVVLTFHGLDIVFPNKLFQKKIVPKYRKYAGFICVSEATAQACVERGFAADKIHVVPNGVDHDIADLNIDEADVSQRFYTQFGLHLHKKKVIISLGRPVKRKGFSWFLEQVMPKLSEDVLFIMVGPRSKQKSPPLWRKILPKTWVHEIDLFLGASNDEARIRTLLRQPDLKKQVIETGAIPYKDVMSLLSIADLFVMPNIKIEGDAEGFGLVALEASLRKTPVLASNMEGITEAIKHEKNGYLLPSGDAEIWIKKIEQLLSNPEDLAQTGGQFQTFTLDNFSWDKMAKGYVEVFQRILK